MMGRDTDSSPTVEQSMAGVLALLIAEREERLNDGSKPQKTEAILAAAGVPPMQIAQLTGKNPDAVRKAIQRSRKPKRKKGK